MAKYILYLRKSQMDRDFDESTIEETLKRHKKKLMEFAKSQKLNVTVILEEVVSGESLSVRPQMMKCLELVNTGEYAGVICMDIDRLSRGDSMDSGYITQVLQINGCKIITPAKTYDLANESDEQFTDMKFMFSRFELKTINKRLVNGRNASVSEGKYVGSVAPFGYEKYKLPGVKGYSLKIVPEQARIVQFIFDLYTEHGLGYGKIVRELDRLGILPTPPISSWDRHVIERILKNPVYVGKIRYRFKKQQKTFVDGKIVKKRVRDRDSYELHDGLHDPIVSEEQWEKSHNTRGENLPTTINRDLCNPFSRVVKCGKCGRTIIRRTTSMRPIVRYRLSCPNRQCNCRSIYLEPFEAAVVSETAKWLKDYMISIDNHTVEKDDTLQLALENIERQIEDLEEQQNKICDLLERDIYTIDMFTKRNEKLKAEISKLNTSKERLKKEISKKEKQAVNVEIIPRVQHLLDSYDIMTPQQKNDLWKEIMVKIELFAEPNAKDFHIKLFPKL